jgi:hypothetical protein
MKLIKIANKIVVSEMLDYHLKNNLSIVDTVFRVGSEAYCDLVNEVRELYKNGTIKLSENDRIIVSKLQTGTRAVFKGKSVVLDSPSRNTGNSKKKYIVYHNSGRKDKDGNIIAKKIEWGDPKLPVRNGDPEAAKNFRARHQCSSKSDQSTPGWWACNIHLFHKQLGLESDRPW